MADGTIDVEALKADYMQFAELFVESVAKQGKEKISKLAETALQQFYGEYPSPSPYGYYRTGQMAMRSWKPWLHYATSFSEGGIQIAPFSLNYDEAGIGSDEILDLVWNKGGHGYVSSLRDIGFVPNVVGTIPFNYVSEIVNSQSFKSGVNNEAKNYAMKNGSYTYLRF